MNRSSKRQPVPAEAARTGTFVLALLLSALTLAGCDSGPRETVVSGKVTVNGAAADPGSKITFLGEGGREASTVIGEGGVYAIPNPPVGAVQVVIVGNAVPKAGAGSTAPAGMKAAPGAPIPMKYAQRDNGLNYTLVEGKQQQIDIDLKP